MRATKDFPVAGQTVEYVFAVIKNIGKGSATKVQFKARYNVRETTNPNYEFSVTRDANLAVLEADKGLAVIIHVGRSPSDGDGVELETVSLTCGNFYADALGEEPRTHTFTAANSTVQISGDCKMSPAKKD